MTAHFAEMLIPETNLSMNRLCSQRVQTKLAKAIAGEAQAAFLSVGPSDILSKFVGESEATVRNLFNQGKVPPLCGRSKNTPSNELLLSL